MIILDKIYKFKSVGLVQVVNTSIYGLWWARAKFSVDANEIMDQSHPQVRRNCNYFSNSNLYSFRVKPRELSQPTPADLLKFRLLGTDL